MKDLAKALLDAYGDPDMKERAKKPGEMAKLVKALTQVMKEQTIIIGGKK